MTTDADRPTPRSAVMAWWREYSAIRERKQSRCNAGPTAGSSTNKPGAKKELAADRARRKAMGTVGVAPQGRS
jgi:hypothetical protein